MHSGHTVQAVQGQRQAVAMYRASKHIAQGKYTEAAGTATLLAAVLLSCGMPGSAASASKCCTYAELTGL
jgi:hypothetical protein